MYAFDISDKTNPTVITSWPGISHAHSCWVFEDGNTLFTGSETTGGHIMSWDVTDLSNIEYLDEEAKSIIEQWNNDKIRFYRTDLATNTIKCHWKRRKQLKKYIE